MRTTRFAPAVEAILKSVEEIDLNQTDAVISEAYCEAVDEALDYALRAQVADNDQYARDNGRDYEVIRDAVRAQQVARYVFEKVSQRCVGRYVDRDSLISCAAAARSAAVNWGR